jgi:putative membrane protein
VGRRFVPEAAATPFPQETSMKHLRLPTVLAVALVPLFAQAAGPNDAQIAAIVVTANQVDIDAGKWAESHASSAEVKDFARRMVTDHTAVNKSATDLAGRLHLTPEDNATAQSLKKGGDDNVANLKTLSGAAFDRAYVDHEVAYHEAVLNALDTTLVPSATNADLKALMIKVRPAFVAHLDHAKMLQARLGK